MPVLKAPFHLSYLLYLARVSENLMMSYLRTALAACRASGVEPSFLLHPLALLGGDQVKELAFFPVMDLSGARKMVLFRKVLRALGERYRLVTMSQHARSILEVSSRGKRTLGREPRWGGRRGAASRLTAEG
jgi:hypothetical protein